VERSDVTIRDMKLDAEDVLNTARLEAALAD
jgi:hypothetical protein